MPIFEVSFYKKKKEAARTEGRGLDCSTKMQDCHIFSKSFLFPWIAFWNRMGGYFLTGKTVFSFCFSPFFALFAFRKGSRDELRFFLSAFPFFRGFQNHRDRFFLSLMIIRANLPIFFRESILLVFRFFQDSLAFLPIFLERFFRKSDQVGEKKREKAKKPVLFRAFS